MLVRWKTMGIPDLLMFCILVCVFGALLSYAVADVPAGRDLIGCQALAAAQQFLFLSTFFWSNALGINITYTIFSFKAVSVSKKRRFCWSFVYAVSAPALLTLITYILSLQEDGIEHFKSPVYREGFFCFIEESIVLYSLFLGPVYVVIMANFCMCTACIVRIKRGLGVTSNDKDRWKKNIVTCVKLSICLGVGWVLFFFVTIFTDNRSLFMCMQIFIEIQGILVVMANVVTWSCIIKVKSYSQTLNISRPSNGSATNSTKPTGLREL